MADSLEKHPLVLAAQIRIWWYGKRLLIPAVTASTSMLPSIPSGKRLRPRLCPRPLANQSKCGSVSGTMASFLGGASGSRSLCRCFGLNAYALEQHLSRTLGILKPREMQRPMELACVLVVVRVRAGVAASSCAAGTPRREQAAHPDRW